ncbi:MAG: DHH family phosphoesterase [Candidatus Enteromonas sp.]|jgi:c-di-AMP phosphodiesterase-like protein|nr:DHH family phosphoesterase [Bacilli bacterium]MEE3298726.1 DHH family phosphoesterase [Candidatus Enteromonas sp.]MEE3401446.1 DHH family phosphoesterase [Candidatus Enteromonas sp.]MEE3431989.1 DHH family phosphoesterase [Candidatus Enteromonas sp.]MEE3442906.1 DHH family phosphoesterase [Candidatus Enteromonas sp.]
MANALRKTRIVAFILALIEIGLFATGIALYLYDIPSGIQAAIKPQFWAFGAGVVAFANIVAVAIIIAHISRIRQKSDLRAADVIGGDVQEAYNFGQIGLVVTDNDDRVIWNNLLFKERSIELLDQNIEEWQPKLRELKDGNNNMTVMIEVDSHTYEVKYLSEAHLYIFKDTTEFAHLSSYERAHSMVLGLIVIDNYSEIVGNAEDENNDIVSRVRGAIFDYGKQFDVVLRRFRGDSYFAVCDYASLERMVNDKFSLLESVRQLGKGTDTIPTLSVGFAHDFQDPEKLSDMAANAINIAMSRGGDQACVSEYNKELKFYGGKTQAVESTSKVKVRNYADGLIGLIRQTKSVLVMGHEMMDMDALGAALGVMVIAEYCGVPCHIIYDPKNTESKTRYAFQSAFTKNEIDRMVYSPRDALDKINDSTLLVVVDVSVPEKTHAPKVLEKSVKTVVIDHHRMGTSFIDQNVLSYVEPSASSASEIVAEFIHYATANPRMEMKQSFATIMLAGMFLDTNFFKSKSTGARTFEAAEFLKTYGADNALADDYLKDEYEEYSLTTKIVSTMKTPYYGVVYCVAEDKDIIESAAISKVANQLMQLKGINAAFVIGRTGEKTIKISCRSDATINVQLLAEKMGGGGHFSMAAANISDQTIEGAETILLDVLATYLNESRSSEKGEY